MRLWASTDSMTLDEFAPHIGETVAVALGLSVSYLGDLNEGRSHRGFPCDLSALGEAGFVQLPNLGQTECAVTGILTAREGYRRIESAFSMHLAGSRKLAYGEEKGSARCEALGRLFLSGKEMSTLGKVYYSARIDRFRSLCLTAGDARFGQWFDVFRYGDLGSDPDVIAAPVCVAELELLI